MANNKLSQARRVQTQNVPANRARAARTKKERSKPGRPRALMCDKRTLKQLQELGSAQCTIEETAGYMGVAFNTLKRFLKEFPEAQQALDTGKANGKLSLRQAQFRLAHKGSVPMLIHLGKAYLGQGDVVVVDDGDKRLVASREANANARELVIKLFGGVDASSKAASDTIAAKFLSTIREPEDPSSEAA